jgi:hypothetical protein
MMILTIILGLLTKQVNYTAAFLHAPIGRNPNWDSLSKEEQRRDGVFVEMPRGFSEGGKVLKLIWSQTKLKELLPAP